VRPTGADEKGWRAMLKEIEDIVKVGEKESGEKPFTRIRQDAPCARPP